MNTPVNFGSASDLSDCQFSVGGNKSLEQARLGLNSDTGSAPPDVRQTADALHVKDDIDELIPYIGGPMPGWACLLTPFFNLLAYVLEKTIYRNVQLRKSSSSLDQDDTDV